MKEYRKKQAELKNKKIEDAKNVLTGAVRVFKSKRLMEKEAKRRAEETANELKKLQEAKQEKVKEVVKSRNNRLNRNRVRKHKASKK